MVTDERAMAVDMSSIVKDTRIAMGLDVPSCLDCVGYSVHPSTFRRGTELPWGICSLHGDCAMNCRIADNRGRCGPEGKYYVRRGSGSKRGLLRWLWAMKW